MVRDTPEQEALQRFRVIKPIAFKCDRTRGDIKDTCLKLNLSERQIYRLIRACIDSPYLDTFLTYGGRSSVAPISRLDPHVESIILEAIEKYWLGKQETFTVKGLYSKVVERCRKAGCSPPSQKTIARRIKQFEVERRARAGQLACRRAGQDSHPNHHNVGVPLQEVQIDHTQVNVILDLSYWGLGLLRPWLTLAMDIATRLIFGYYISLTRPTSDNTMFALLQGVLPKTSWFAKRGVDYQYFCDRVGMEPMPLKSFMDTLSVDNARDLVNSRVRNAVRFLGGELFTRPVARPYYGGHIERVIGTYLHRMKMLPGSTYANTVEKDSYPAEAKAFLTVEDFEQWLLMNILEYHLSKHRTLGCTPLQMYEALEPTMPREKLRAVDLHKAQFALLPREYRTISRNGILLNYRNYWHNDLKSLVGRRAAVIYQPWDISSVILSLDGVSPHLPLRLINDGNPVVRQDLQEMRRNRPDLVAETKRQGHIALEINAAKIDFIEQQQVQRKLQPKRIGDLVRRQACEVLGPPEDATVFAVSEFPDG